MTYYLAFKENGNRKVVRTEASDAKTAVINARQHIESQLRLGQLRTIQFIGYPLALVC